MTTVLQRPADLTRREARCTTTQAIGDELRNRSHSQTCDPRSEMRLNLKCSNGPLRQSRLSTIGCIERRTSCVYARILSKCRFEGKPNRI
jgi:hypothetical protein